MDEIKDAMVCLICNDIATLPVHGVCCDTAKSLQPACLLCVREYCDLNNIPMYRRSRKIKSWTGCGCELDLTKTNSKDFYRNTNELEKVRNILGPSKCQHKLCEQVFETSAELRRHLTGKATPSDNFNNCLEAMCKCKYCNLYRKRKIIEGSHFYEEHATIYCNVCNKTISYSIAKQHYKMHHTQLDKFDYSVKNKIINITNVECLF